MNNVNQELFNLVGKVLKGFVNYIESNNKSNDDVISMINDYT